MNNEQRGPILESNGTQDKRWAKLEWNQLFVNEEKLN